MCVHDFLKHEVISSFKKITPQKFAIKADVFVDLGFGLANFLLKVRVLQHANTLLVEFNRRSGDGVAFGKVFDQASSFLKDRFSSGKAAPQAARALFVPPPPPPPVHKFCEGELQPLMDMVENSSVPSVRAEAIAALTNIAGAGGAPSIAAKLQETQAKEVLTSLWSDSRIDIAYPAARLAFELARHAGAIEAAQLLPAALQQLVAAETDLLVRVQLAEAVRAGAHSARSSSCGVELRAQLSEALRSAACRSSDVSGPLREALTALEV